MIYDCIDTSHKEESLRLVLCSIVVVFDDLEATKIVSSLPMNLSQRSSSSSSATMTSLPDETDDSEGASASAAGLKIAWQYAKYLKEGNPIIGQQTRTTPVASRGGGDTKAAIFCNSYDISAQLQSSIIERNPPFIICTKGKQFYSVISEVLSFIKNTPVTRY